MKIKPIVLSAIVTSAILGAGIAVADTRIDAQTKSQSVAKASAATPAAQASGTAKANTSTHAGATVDHNSMTDTTSVVAAESTRLGKRIAAEAGQSADSIGDAAVSSEHAIDAATQGSTTVETADGISVELNSVTEAAGSSTLDAGTHSAEAISDEGQRLGAALAGEAKQSAGAIADTATKLGDNAVNAEVEAGLDASAEIKVASDAREQAAALKTTAVRQARETTATVRDSVADARRQAGEQTRELLRNDIRGDITGQVKGGVNVQGVLR